MTPSYRFIIVVACAFLASLTGGCKKKGTGENIASGDDCRQGDPKSRCAPGLYCDSNGKEVQEGDNFVSPGKCRTQKPAGSPCYFPEECAPPAICMGAFSPGSTGGVCSAP